MKICCPNCDAEYQIKEGEAVHIGLNVQCSYCTQEWFQYNFSQSNKSDSLETTNIKKLAAEEYQISKHYFEGPPTSKERKDISDGTRFRLQESSEKLRETQKIVINEVNDSDHFTKKETHWTIFGFVTVSLLFVIATALYIFNFELQKVFPEIQKVFLYYRLFVDQTIVIIQNFYSKTSKILS